MWIHACFLGSWEAGGGLWVWSQTVLCCVALSGDVLPCAVFHLPESHCIYQRKLWEALVTSDSYVRHLCRCCDKMMNEDTSSYSTSQTFKFKYAFWQRRMACQYESINLLKWFQEYRKLYTIWYQAVRSPMYKRENDHLRQNSNGIDFLLDSYEIVVVG